MSELWRLCVVVIFFGFIFKNDSYSMGGSPPAPDRTFDQKIRDLTREMIDEHYPSLKKYKIKIRTFTEEGFFFQAQVKKTTVFRRAEKRVYRLEYNPELRFRSPSDDALRAILLHELTHIRDYTKMSPLDLIVLAFRYSNSHSFVRKYERKTDLRALELGRAEGLIQYREWLYQQIDEDAEKTKRRNYFTPKEIREWQDNHASH